MSRFTTCGLTILLAFAPVVLAVDGTVLINQSTITNGLTGCPTGGHFPIIICQSGSYKLSGNLTVPDANTDAIDVSANDVTIDLNGFSISGPGTKGSSFIVGTGIQGSGINTSVFNGTIRGMGNLGINLNSGGRVYKVQATANGSDGIQALDSSLVSECISRANGGRGINVVGTATNNLVDGNAGDGIAGFGQITGNTVLFNAGNGINLEGDDHTLISGNLVTSNGKGGIVATCPSSIIGNQVGGNSAGSIFTSGSGCLLVNNN